MKRLLVFLFFVLGFQATAHAFFIDFENGTDGALVTDITGVSFQSYNGYDAVYTDCRTGSYNCTSDDLGYSNGSGLYHHNGNFAIFAGTNATAQGLIVDFTNNDGTWFTTGYSAYSNFYVDAYLTDGSMVSVWGAANTGGLMEFLTVNATVGLFIDYLVLHDTGNYWIVDDMSGDATGISVPVPEPSLLTLLTIGLLGIGITRRKLV